MAPVTREHLEAALRSAIQTVERLKAALAQLDAQEMNGAPTLKLPTGRLSEYGLARLRALVNAGRNPSSIARELDMTVPAVMNQKTRYLKEKAARS